MKFLQMISKAKIICRDWFCSCFPIRKTEIHYISQDSVGSKDFSESGVTPSKIQEGRGNGKPGEGKPTRVRTVLNEKQLHTLRNCYNQNPRPDALMMEQLVEMTSLSPRVIRVWFQNKRCKDEKKAILMKQMQHIPSLIHQITQDSSESKDASIPLPSEMRGQEEEGDKSESKMYFPCTDCERVYWSIGALQMHMGTHTLPFKCKHCGSAFSRLWLLQGHLCTSISTAMHAD